MDIERVIAHITEIAAGDSEMPVRIRDMHAVGGRRDVARFFISRADAYGRIQYLIAADALSEEPAHAGGGIYLHAVKSNILRRAADRENLRAIDIVAHKIIFAVFELVERAVVGHSQNVFADFFNAFDYLGVLINIIFFALARRAKGQRPGVELSHRHDGDILRNFVKLGKAHIERMLYRVSLLDFNNGSEAGFIPSPVDGKPFYLKIFASAYLEISVAVKDEHRALGVDENILERI